MVKQRAQSSESEVAECIDVLVSSVEHHLLVFAEHCLAHLCEATFDSLI